MNAGLLHILRHSLGLDGTGRGQQYRNSFVTGPGGADFDKCRELVATGHMVDHGPREITGGMHCFSVTPAGVAIASKQDPLPRRERSRRIYRYWLGISDCYPDSTFKDFLTSPHFAESRTRARNS